MSKLLVSFLTIVLAIMLCFTLVRGASGVTEPLSFREAMLRVSRFDIDFSKTRSYIEAIRDAFEQMKDDVPEWGKKDADESSDESWFDLPLPERNEDGSINADASAENTANWLTHIFQTNPFEDFWTWLTDNTDEDDLLYGIVCGVDYISQCFDFIISFIAFSLTLVGVLIPFAVDITIILADVFDLLFYFLGIGSFFDTTTVSTVAA